MDGIIDLLDGTWQFNFSEATALLIPFVGKITVDTAFEIAPDENGVVDVGIEEYTIDPIHRPF